MSVILAIENFGVAQGWSDRTRRSVTNSGDENIEKVYLKVIDALVFDKLEVACINTNEYSVLNEYNTASEMKLYDAASGAAGGDILPASSTKWISFDITVKAGAPIQVNNLVPYWQYITY